MRKQKEGILKKKTYIYMGDNIYILKLQSLYKMEKPVIELTF